METSLNNDFLVILFDIIGYFGISYVGYINSQNPPANTKKLDYWIWEKDKHLIYIHLVSILVFSLATVFPDNDGNHLFYAVILISLNTINCLAIIYAMFFPKILFNGYITGFFTIVFFISICLLPVAYFYYTYFTTVFFVIYLMFSIFMLKEYFLPILKKEKLDYYREVVIGILPLKKLDFVFGIDQEIEREVLFNKVGLEKIIVRSNLMKLTEFENINWRFILFSTLLIILSIITSI